MTQKRKLQLKGAGRGTAIVVRVTPRSSKNEVVEVQADGIVKIRLTAPPVDGKANEALIDLLADFFGVAKKEIEIVSGVSAREKLITILNIEPEDVIQKLDILKSRRIVHD